MTLRGLRACSFIAAYYEHAHPTLGRSSAGNEAPALEPLVARTYLAAVTASIDTRLSAACERLGAAAVRACFQAAVAPTGADAPAPVGDAPADAALVETLVDAMFAYYQLPPKWQLRGMPGDLRAIADSPEWCAAVPLLARSLPEWTAPQSLFKIVQLLRTTESVC